MKLASMLGKFTRGCANQDSTNQDPRKTYPDLYHQARERPSNTRTNSRPFS